MYIYNCFIPFAYVEHPRGLEDERSEFVAQTIVGYALQAPVPIVIVVLAERVGAIDNPFPHGPIVCHAHVVFAADPLRYLGL